MSAKPVTLINILEVSPGKQDDLLAMLQENIKTVISTLGGWKASRLIATDDGGKIVIYSEWETPEAVEAMRNDPRIRAYFPKIMELAKFNSMSGALVLDENRQGLTHDA